MNKKEILEKLESVLDYAYELEIKYRDELLLNFNKLAEHKLEIDKIMDHLIDLKIEVSKNE